MMVGEPDRDLRSLRHGLHLQMTIAFDELVLSRIDQSFACSQTVANPDFLN